VHETVPDIRRDVMKTRAIVSELERNVANTQIMVSNIHRTVAKSQEGGDGRNLLVSDMNCIHPRIVLTGVQIQNRLAL